MVMAETETETATISMAVADLAAQALEQQHQQLQQHIQLEPPAPLPTGWIMKESRSQPGVYYYYNQETFESTWHAPSGMTNLNYGEDEEQQRQQQQQSLEESIADQAKASLATAQEVAAAVAAAEAAASAERSRSKRPDEVASSSSSSNKRAKTSSSSSSSSSNNKPPKEVRCLHILKKHKDSRRPASWRSDNKPITLTRDEAREELEGLLEILQEERDNPENLIATFKELASQESDCSSAKREGDLGFFGRKKMRPEFEQASFALHVNGLSEIIETASGWHIILRLE